MVSPEEGERTPGVEVVGVQVLDTGAGAGRDISLASVLISSL